MPLYFSDYDKRSKIEQALDYITEAMNKIREDEKELVKAATGTENKIMAVTQCNQMGKVYSSISSYADTSSRYGYRDTCQNICAKAIKHATDLWAEVEKTHIENLPAIENNKQITEYVKALMNKIGILPTFSTYEYKSNRSRTKTQNTHSAGYIDDLRRCVIIDDGYTSAKNQYEYFLKRVEQYRKEQEQRVREEEKKKEAEEKKQRESKELAALVVKYGLDYNCGWPSVKETILSKNKYLALAYALEMQRNDWSGGFYIARDAVRAFEVETEIDDKIYNELSEILEDVEDGRAFRDCEYNYSVLYGMVEDQSLVSDLRIVLQHYEMYY
jgi:hypothetical protein